MFGIGPLFFNPRFVSTWTWILFSVLIAGIIGSLGKCHVMQRFTDSWDMQRGLGKVKQVWRRHTPGLVFFLVSFSFLFQFAKEFLSWKMDRLGDKVLDTKAALISRLFDQGSGET